MLELYFFIGSNLRWILDRAKAQVAIALYNINDNFMYYYYSNAI